MCISCQAMKNKRELIRIVKTPSDEITIDPTGKKAGRGAYLCKEVECLNKAVKEKRLERALKHAISAEVYEQLRQDISHE
ncbi:MAG: YlxR family protein [Sporomusaceae bacterium]|nr:YlxR family protein [Sporomusaceae bacterium]